MSYTKVQICNLALAKVGNDQTQITSLEDGTTEASLCKKFYEPTLKELLSQHTWNFSLKLATLSASTTSPTFGWDYSYPLPGDCLRPLELRSDSTTQPVRYLNEWKIVGRNIYTNASNAYLLYVSYDEDPNQMTPLFIKALYTSLASKLAYVLLEDPNMVNMLERELNELILPEAKRVNGFEGYDFPSVDSEWLEATHVSRSMYSDMRGFSAENYGSLT